MGTQEEATAEKLRRRNRELTILNSIAQALNSSVDLQQTLHAALAQAAELLDLQTGWIWLLEEETAEPYLAAAQNLPPGLQDNPERMEGDCYCLDTYRAGDMDGAANINVLTCSRLKKLDTGTRGLRYHASIPLYAHGKEIGVLNVASPDWRGLSDEDLRLLHTVGDLLGIAVERARLFSHSAELGASEERNRLAREIHDTLAQGLAGIALQLETADALLETGVEPVRIRQTLQHALQLTRENLEEARRSVLDLRAAPLESRTLSQALAELARELEERSGAQVEYQATGASSPLPARLEGGLYRIAQEALGNAVEHSGADRIRIRLDIQPGEVRLLVQDDGSGFDTQNIPRGRFGLVGLNERARMLGGSFHVQSKPGVGTVIEVRVPIERKT